MQIDLQRLLNYLLLGLSLAGGVISGIAGGRLVALSLGQEPFSPPVVVSHQPEVRQLQEDDFQIILQRNLFNSKAAGDSVEKVDLTTTIATSASPDAVVSLGNLTLVGTVVAGKESLALIRIGAKPRVLRLDEEVLPGVKVVAIGRKQVVLSDHGTRQELLLKQSKEAKSKPVRRTNKLAAGRGIVAVDKGTWKVAKTVVDSARKNFTALLQTARMVPQVKNGQTIGFKLIEMEKGSLLEQIGLKVGDLIVEVNQVKLNSPEKALQIFQQVREANNITLGLIRNGKPETFEYSFE